MKDFIFDNHFCPKKMSFPTYKFLCQAATIIGVETNFCAILPFIIQNRTMTGQFSAHIMTSVIGGFIISFLTFFMNFGNSSARAFKDEKSSSKVYICLFTTLFFIGVLFGYYVLTPLSVNFLGTYQVSKEVMNEIDLGSLFHLSDLLPWDYF